MKKKLNKHQFFYRQRFKKSTDLLLKTKKQRQNSREIVALVNKGRASF
jgi:hypothetical protein